MIQGLTARNKAVDKARTFGEKNSKFSFTRRLIAITCVGSIVLLPLLASTFIPAMPLNYGWLEDTRGFWIFSDPRAIMQFVTLSGMTILPFHTHMMSAIAGLYFGASAVK